jgi:predicted ATPase
MINEWSIENFKSVRAPATLKLAPLTLFVGQNSAGKSTVIQSILLTAQTLLSNASSRSVVLNGRIVRLGSFSDIYANNANSGSINISFTLGRSPLHTARKTPGPVRSRNFYMTEFQNRMASVSVSYSFSSGGDDETSNEFQLQPRLEQGALSYNTTEPTQRSVFDFRRQPDSAEDALRKLGVAPENVRVSDLSALEYGSKAGITTATYRRAYRLPRQTQPAGIVLRHFLPVGTCVAYDAVAEEVDSAFDFLADTYSAYRHRTNASDWIQSVAGNAGLKNIVIGCYVAALEKVSSESTRIRAMSAIELLNKHFTEDALQRAQSILTAAAKKSLAIQLSEHEAEIKSLLRAGRPVRREISSFPPPEQLTYAGDYVSSFFAENLKYLGPLRDEPKAIYPLVGYSDPKDVGFRGEFTAAVLDENRAQRILYVPSASFPFAEQADVSTVPASLIDAVRDWLRHLGIAKEVRTEDKGKFGHQLTIATTDGNALHDLTHVGVGVSQALPIVVLSLVALPGSTLIFEQPELHLNPRVQTRLADFFMSLILAGKQCIIETHSEYLVSRLRYLAATAKDTALAQYLKIYFVEKPEDESIYREVTITNTGVIRSWPEGFFDETEKNAEAIIRAQLEKGRERRSGMREGENK